MTEYVQHTEFHKTDEQKEMRKYLSNKEYRNDIMITLNTYSKMSYDQLNKLIQELSNRVNYKLNRYYRKQPTRRITLHCFNEFKDYQVKTLFDKPKYGDEYQKVHIPPNTHSHIIPKIPKEFNTKKVFKLLNRFWSELDPHQQKTYQFHRTIKRNRDGRWSNVCYATKDYRGNTYDDTNKYFVPR